MSYRNITLIAILLAVAPLVRAAEKPLWYQKSMIGVGVAYEEVDSKLRSTVGDLPEVKVDLDDLGLDTSETSLALEGRWRFAPRWMLVGLAYRFSGDGSTTVEQDFNFDGREFRAGAGVDTDIRMDTYILDVMYSVYQSERSEIMLGGGVHAIDLDASITGRAFIENREIERTAASSDLLAPLPNLRAQAFYYLGGGWTLGLTLGWLSANYEDYDGDFVYVHPRLGYAFGDHWLATLGYQYVEVNLTENKSNRHENEFDITLQGPTLFLGYRF